MPSQFHQRRFARSKQSFRGSKVKVSKMSRPNPKKSLRRRIWEIDSKVSSREIKLKIKDRESSVLGEVPERPWLWPKVKSQNSSGHSHCCYLRTFRRTYIRKGSFREYWKNSEKGKPPVKYTVRISGKYILDGIIRFIFKGFNFRKRRLMFYE